MILMAMGQHQTSQFIAPVGNEFQIRKNNINTWGAFIGKGNAKINHDPAVLIMVKIDIHANLARSA